MSITKSFLKEIYTQLETDFFSIGDFKVEQEEETDTQFGTITIIYSFDENYYFSISLEDDFETAKVPGNIKLLEEETASDKKELFSEIKNWLYNLKEELLTGPIIRQFEQFKEDVDQRFQDIERTYNSLEDKYFSKIEAEDFRERLEKLEKVYVEQIENQMKNNEMLAI
ncbi:hypothetical protein ABH892_004999 [Paenibacillus sp. RC254]|uniref:hypothetical protein n=1 Tax=unclassified Paenibacillus TaxID=185978 RepID=UPI0024B9E77D|nr:MULTISPECIES: hypothetical protein [unclassified Paenibacillus]